MVGVDRTGARKYEKLLAGHLKRKHQRFVMPIEYDAFRSASWAERLTLFNSSSAHEKAELVRAHIAAWLTLHHMELTEAQIGIVNENIDFVTPELYLSPISAACTAQLKELEARTVALLSRSQMREALTMHWDLPGQPHSQE
jgi:hypothetical protein